MKCRASHQPGTPPQEAAPNPLLALCVIEHTTGVLWPFADGYRRQGLGAVTTVSLEPRHDN